MKKICSHCHLEKDEQEFSFKKKERNLRHSVCRVCMKHYNRQHYLNNKDVYKRRAKKGRLKYKIEVYGHLFEYCRRHPCVDCGESDFVVLDFDHVDGKEVEISTMVANGRKWSEIKAELKKCVVRCANCHRRKTARESGWYKCLGV